MIEPKFISGPPGTGKTSTFITQKYTELLKQYTYDKIIILSHTNVAADEIRDEILKLPQVKEKGLTKKLLNTESARYTDIVKVNWWVEKKSLVIRIIKICA